MNNKVITIFGVGFVGKSLIFQLLQRGYIVKAVCRNPYLRGNLKSMANIGQLEIKYGDITKIDSIEHYFKSSDIIINIRFYYIFVKIIVMTLATEIFMIDVE